MARFETLWRILTLHCDEASRLASASLDRPLGPGDRAAAALHRLSCRSCRRHRRQILDLRRIALRMAEHPAPPAPPLPDDVRDRLRRSLGGD